jgi:hypothetical protein
VLYNELAFQDLIGVYLVVDILVPIELFDGEGAELASISSNKPSSHDVDEGRVSNCVVGTFAGDDTGSGVCVRRSDDKGFRRTGVGD